MALLESCCCWRSVRKGSYASAIYTMVYFSLTTLVVGCYLYEEQVVMTTANTTRAAGTTVSLLQAEVEAEAAVAFSVAVLVCSSCGLLSTCLLLIGLRLDNRILLIPWMIVVALTAVVDVSHIFHVVFISDANLKPEIAMLFTVDFFLLSLNYQEYKAGRGRAVDEDSFLRFAPVRYLAQPTATSILSTRRGTHTTVHDGHSPSGDAKDGNGALGVNGGLALVVGAGPDPGVLRLAVPPPPYCKKQAGAGVGAAGAPPQASSMRKHVKFPDMCNARVILDEDSSPGDSPGAEACGYMEEGSTGMEWPMDEKALLSAA